MIVREFAEFKTTIPEDGDHYAEGGKAYATDVAIAISEILNDIGYDADPPENAGDHGWDFEVRIKGYPEGSRVWCTITLIGDYVLRFENKTWGWRGRARKRYPQPYVDALRDLSQAIRADPRFYDLRWADHFDDLETDKAAPDPVDEG
jgi:hypothetical protein